MLIVIVVILFLQTWRAAVIPIVAIPVSLVGSFVVMGRSRLVQHAIAVRTGARHRHVVDDAIVVVENVERKLSEGLRPPKRRITMDSSAGRSSRSPQP